MPPSTGPLLDPPAGHAGPRTLARIVAEASTLQERLAARAPGAASEALLRSWCERAAGGSAPRFARRLAAEGLSEATAGTVLGPVALAAGEPLPRWARLLAEVLADGHRADEPAELPLDAAAPLPFEELLTPFVRVAREQVLRARPALHDQLAPGAWRDVQRALLVQLTTIAEQVLFLEFVLYRNRRGGGQPTLESLMGGPAPRAHYHAFLRELRAGGMERLYADYPVLARMLGTRTTFWVDATVELVTRFADDAASLAATFNGGAPAGRVDRVTWGISDSHRRGRGVAVLGLEGGCTVVYKPKAMGLERTFAALVDQLNERAGRPLLRAAAVIDRAGYGWMEFVEHTGCDDDAGVHDFHRHSGMLLCLLHLLGGADFHSENVIANGRFPVPIDLEVLMTPREDHDRHDLFRDSVLRTHLLPFRFLGAQARVALEGGLAHVAESPPVVHVVWNNPNSDRMARVERVSRRQSQHNLTSLGGEAVDPAGHVDAIMSGFREMYELVTEMRAELLAPDGPLAPFHGERTRYLFRATSVYANLLRRARHPRFLRSGLDFGVELEVLMQRGLTESAEPCWPLFRAEQSELQRLDIPMFHMDVEGTALHTEAERVPGFKRVSGWDQMLDRIRRLNADDRDLQAQHIRLAFTPNGHRAAPLGELDAAAARTEAAEIRADLVRLALPAAGGGPTWTGTVWDARGEGQMRFRLIDDSLELGAAGIALFGAALARVSPTDDARRFAGEVAGGVAARVMAGAADAPGIGGLTGAGGLVYALTRAGGWLDDPRLLDAARRAASLVTPEAVRADRVLDVRSGAAGAVLGLLALHDARGDAAVLRAAITCGDHLLGARAVHPITGHRVWPADGHGRTGFPHGTGGIGVAMARLGARTGEARFADAALEALDFEDELSDPAGGWFEELSNEGVGGPVAEKRACAWCHGAAGIGLSRLALLGDVAAPERLHADVRAAAEATLAYGLNGPDFLCCGSAGRVDLLFTAGRALGNDAWVQRAHALAREIVDRANQRTSYGTTIPNAYAPSLFHGLSGIGYQLLRLHHPAELPSVLAWE